MLDVKYFILFSSAEIDMHGSLFSEYSLTATGSEINSLFGQRLCSLREKNGFSTEEFAIQIDISSYELEELEAGRREADLEMLDAMSMVLHLSLSELLRGL